MNAKKLRKLRKDLRHLNKSTSYGLDYRYTDGRLHNVNTTLRLVDTCARGAYQRIKRSLSQ